MRVELDDETVDEIVKNWLTTNAIQLKNDPECLDIAEACRNLLEINWPHLYE